MTRNAVWTIVAGVGTVGTLALAPIVACSVSQVGAGPVADAGVDGAEDAAADQAAPDTGSMDTGPQDTGIDVHPDGPSCAGVMCNGKCVQSSDCSTCAGASLLCAPTGTCVASCGSCADPSGAKLDIECFACDSTHHNALGSCAYDDASSYCLNGDYSTAYADGSAGTRCDCSGDAGVNACPGANEVCAVIGLGNFCFECGEMTVAPIDGRLCRSGGKCNAATHTCQ